MVVVDVKNEENDETPVISNSEEAQCEPIFTLESILFYFNFIIFTSSKCDHKGT